MISILVKWLYIGYFLFLFVNILVLQNCEELNCIVGRTNECMDEIALTEWLWDPAVIAEKHGTVGDNEGIQRTHASSQWDRSKYGHGSFWCIIQMYTAREWKGGRVFQRPRSPGKVTRETEVRNVCSTRASGGGVRS